MPIDRDALLNWHIPDVEQTYSLRDTLFYALSVGVGADPEDEQQLRYAYEKDLRVLPSMVTVLAASTGWQRDRGTGINPKGTLAGDHSFEIHRPLPVEGALISKTRITDVLDMGEGRPALVYTERKCFDSQTQDHLFTVNATLVSTKDGGFGSPSGPTRPKVLPPERNADIAVDHVVPGNAALLFRLHNKLDPYHADQHADLELAHSLGNHRPSLHGLYTFGVACNALIRTVAADQPLAAMSARFSATAFPGDTLRTEIWQDGNQIFFRCTAAERNKVVLNIGHAQLSPCS